VFPRPTVIFTANGTWDIRSGVSRATVDPSVVVLGAASRAYRATHQEQIPSDRTMFLEFLPTEDGSAFGRSTGELYEDVFSRQVVANTTKIARLVSALARVSDGPHARLRTDVLSMELLIELAEATSPVRTQRAIRPDVKERVVRAREYLDEHLSEPIDLRTLAREVSLSPFHLARLFRQEVGESPHRYLVRRRLDRAADLLVTTPLTITQVRERGGVGAPGHLAQAFRRRFGVPPSVYRTLAP
jgi:AraC-like DNA-binding protein